MSSSVEFVLEARLKYAWMVPARAVVLESVILRGRLWPASSLA